MPRGSLTQSRSAPPTTKKMSTVAMPARWLENAVVAAPRSKRSRKGADLAREGEESEELVSLRFGHEPREQGATGGLVGTDEHSQREPRRPEPRLARREHRNQPTDDEAGQGDQDGALAAEAIIHESEGQRSCARRHVDGNSENDDFGQAHAEGAGGIDSAEREYRDQAVVVDESRQEELGRLGVLTHFARGGDHVPVCLRQGDPGPGRRPKPDRQAQHRHAEHREPDRHEQIHRPEVETLLGAEAEQIRSQGHGQGEGETGEATRVAEAPAPAGGPADRSRRRELRKKRVVENGAHLEGQVGDNEQDQGEKHCAREPRRHEGEQRSRDAADEGRGDQVLRAPPAPVRQRTGKRRQQSGENAAHRYCARPGRRPADLVRRYCLREVGGVDECDDTGGKGRVRPVEARPHRHLPPLSVPGLRVHGTIGYRNWGRAA